MTIRTAPLVLTILSLSYIPVFLFIAGWCKVWIAVPLCLLLIVILAKFGKGMITPPGRVDYDSYDVRMHPAVFVFICLFIVSFGLFSGYGHWADSTLDWPKHNAILHDITSNAWPVYYQWTDGSHRMLSYYTGVYMLPAAIGKVWGGNIVAECALGFYLSALMLCFMLLLINILRCSCSRKQILCILFLLLFYGMPTIAHKLNAWMGVRGGGQGVIADLPNIYYLNIKPFILVFSTYIQGIAPLGLCLCLIADKNPAGNIGVYLLPILLFTPFILVGAMMLYGSSFFIQLYKKEISANYLFTLNNLICLLTGTVLLLYFSGNIFLDKPGNAGFALLKIQSGRNLLVFTSFCIFQFGLHLTILWNTFHKDPLFISLAISLLLVPFFTMGVYNDWCQNCPLPLTMLLFIYVWRFLNMRQNRWKKLGLISMLIMGLIVPMKEAKRIVNQGVNSTHWNYQTDGLMDHLNDEDPANRLSYRYNYVSGDINTDLFYQYFARKNDL